MKNYEKLNNTDTFLDLVNKFNTNVDSSNFIDKTVGSTFHNGVIFTGNETIDGNKVFPRESVYDDDVVNSNTVLDNFKLFFGTTNNVVELDQFPIDLLSYNDNKLHFLFIKEDLTYRISKFDTAYCDEILLLRFSIDTNSKWYQLYVVAPSVGTPKFDSDIIKKEGLAVTTSGLNVNIDKGYIRRSGINFNDSSNSDIIKFAYNQIPIVYLDKDDNMIFPTYTIDMGSIIYNYNYDLTTDSFTNLINNTSSLHFDIQSIKELKDLYYGFKEKSNDVADEIHLGLENQVSNDDLLKILDGYLSYIKNICNSVDSFVSSSHVTGSSSYISSINQNESDIRQYCVDYLLDYSGSLIPPRTVTENQVTYIRQLVSYIVLDDTSIYNNPLDVLLNNYRTYLESYSYAGSSSLYSTNGFVAQYLFLDIYRSILFIKAITLSTSSNGYGKMNENLDRLEVPLLSYQNSLVPIGVVITDSILDEVHFELDLDGYEKYKHLIPDDLRPYLYRDFDYNTPYSQGDIVSYGKYFYNCIYDGYVAGIPITSTTHFFKLDTLSLGNTFFNLNTNFKNFVKSYSSSTTYNLGDIALYQHKLYMAIYTTSFSNKTPTDTTYWQLLSNGFSSVISQNYRTTWQFLDRGYPILKNDDLNDYTTKGNYYSAESAITATLSNKPSALTIAFKLTVEYNINTNRILQRIVSNSDNISIWYRYLTGNGWGNWYKVNMTQA